LFDWTNSSIAAMHKSSSKESGLFHFTKVKKNGSNLAFLKDTKASFHMPIIYEVEPLN
jgi:hypothetical protein